MGAQGEDINDTDATDTADAKEDDEKKAEDEDEEEQDFDIDEEEAKADTLADNDYFQVTVLIISCNCFFSLTASNQPHKKKKVQGLQAFNEELKGLQGDEYC